LFLALCLDAQVNPESKWRTLKTERFYIHYTPELEDVARRTAVQAESAYAQLAALLKPPRGRIDVIIGDNVDGPNGYATPYPTNRIGIYAASHVLENSLRFTDDHIQLVLTHELTHIFHLDRAGGWWGAAQKIFGRYPLFFPNAYQPTWMIEGLATYYESRITGAGRVEGSDHRMIARSAAMAHRFPRIDQLSAAQSMFPYGYITYTYGSLFLDHLAKTHGDSAMEKFVAASSRRILPWTLNGPAKRAFGMTLTRAYRLWSDSLVRSASTSPWVDPIPGWRDLTVEGAYANFPRWANDSTILYTGTPGKESFGAYRLYTSNVKRETSSVGRSDAAPRERIARRHSRSPNVLLSNGDLLYSEMQFSGIYDVRSDLYVDRKRGGKRRLTHNARLALPDARAGDDRIVAVQLVSAGSRLVLVSRDGRTITPITGGGPDESWAEPRWSPDGKSIAAIRWTRGGTNAVIVLDTAGATRALIQERAMMTSPSWSPDGAYVYFDSDRDGVPNLYRASVRHPERDTIRHPERESSHPERSEGSALSVVERVSGARTGLFEAQVSPSGKQLAAVVFKADGYHIGIAPIDSVHATPLDSIPDVAPRAPVPSHQSPVTSHKYNSLRQLVPRYWFPYASAALDSNSARYGIVTSGQDIAGRHAYDASFAVPSDGSGLTGALFYQNATLGRPLLDFYYTQDWSNRAQIFDRSNGDAVVGQLRRRIRDASVALYFPRPRIRTFSYLNIGLGYEARNYVTAPAAAIDRIDSLYRETYYYPRVAASFGWSNTQTPLISISQEDGISFASTVRYRWRSSPAATDTTVTGARVSTLSTSGVTALSLYKSLDLGGFAHHVIAARGAFGAQDNRGADYFEVGGISGDALDVLPGYYLGEGRRTFSVRGFPEATLNGIRAFQGSVEYRAPLRLTGRGIGTLPVFFDRMSITAFGDVGSAWCPGTYAARSAPATSLCTVNDVALAVVPLEPEVIASAGGELNLTAAILTWDSPIRWRAGFAVPLVAPTGITKPNASAYLAVGVSF
jgi:hypothetical protein